MVDGGVEPGEWVRTLAQRLGLDPPSDGDVEDLLSLAGTAAHTAERWVAPVSTWLVAAAGLPTSDARVLVERLADELVVTSDTHRAGGTADQ